MADFLATSSEDRRQRPRQSQSRSPRRGLSSSLAKTQGWSLKVAIIEMSVDEIWNIWTGENIRCVHDACS